MTGLRTRLGLRPEVVEPPWPEPRPRPEGQPPAVVAVTMARDEGPMIRKWVDHYTRELGAGNVVVVDDNSSDGSTDDLPCTVHRIPYLGRYSFERSRMGIVSGLARGLLFAYDAVLFADADEFVVADPRKYATLVDFVADRPDRQAVGVQAYNVVHDVDREAALSLDEPVLRQRRYAKFMPLMCKPSLKWTGADWAHASHAVHCPFEVDPDLYMFHLKFADRAALEASAARRHHLSTTENRAGQTSWTRPADEMVALLDDVAAAIAPTVEADGLTRFRPRETRVERIVRHEGRLWRATGDGQVFAMRKRPLVRVPRRFQDLV